MTGTRKDWLELLKQEKELTRRSDELAQSFLFGNNLPPLFGKMVCTNLAV
jgi:hypothetical protein